MIPYPLTFFACSIPLQTNPRDRESLSWYQKYDGFRHLLTPEYLSSAPGEAGITDYESDDDDGHNTIDKKTARVLIVGAGNDTLGEEMMIDGWEGGIVNVDYSSVVVQQMREKYDDAFHKALLEKKMKGSASNGNDNDSSNAANDSFVKMTYNCHDITKALPYADRSFDLIICKATLDAILCSTGSGHSARAFMEESCRILNKEHGVLVTITYGTKESRLVYFEKNTRDPTDEWWKGGVTFHRVLKPAGDGDAPRITARNANSYHSVIIAKKYGIGGPALGHDSPTSVQDDTTATASLRSIGSSLEKRLFIGIIEEDDEEEVKFGQDQA